MHILLSSEEIREWRASYPTHQPHFETLPPGRIIREEEIKGHKRCMESIVCILKDGKTRGFEVVHRIKSKKPCRCIRVKRGINQVGNGIMQFSSPTRGIGSIGAEHIRGGTEIPIFILLLMQADALLGKQCLRRLYGNAYVCIDKRLGRLVAIDLSS
jgi:hypothetical protein